MLTHTAGFSESLDPRSGLRYSESDDRVRAILADRSSAPAGDRSFGYSDAGAHLLTAIISQATGQSALQFARANLFDPVEIPASPLWSPCSWTKRPGTLTTKPASPGRLTRKDTTRAAMGLKLRPQDLARIGQLYLDGGRWNDEQVVSASWVDTSTTAQVDASGNSDAYGYLWWVTEVDGDPAYVAFGLGGQMIASCPSRPRRRPRHRVHQRDNLRFNKAVRPSLAIRMVEKSIAPQFDTTD